MTIRPFEHFRAGEGIVACAALFSLLIAGDSPLCLSFFSPKHYYPGSGLAGFYFSNFEEKHFSRPSKFSLHYMYKLLNYAEESKLFISLTLIFKLLYNAVCSCIAKLFSEWTNISHPSRSYVNIKGSSMKSPSQSYDNCSIKFSPSQALISNSIRKLNSITKALIIQTPAEVSRPHRKIFRDEWSLCPQNISLPSTSH